MFLKKVKSVRNSNVRKQNFPTNPHFALWVWFIESISSSFHAFEGQIRASYN